MMVNADTKISNDQSWHTPRHHFKPFFFHPTKYLSKNIYQSFIFCRLMILTVWLEIHCKLKTPTKLFCPCPNSQKDNEEPMTHICPICTGQPGALPALQPAAITQAIRLWHCLHATINQQSRRDRKSYFYPDLPMGYQITQFWEPILQHGSVTYFLDANYTQKKTTSIKEAHLETDTGKMIHMGTKTYIDYNRAGTPLIEIVTWPDFSSADEVLAFLKHLQKVLQRNDISDANMEKGQMRVDVNISVRPDHAAPLGTRVEYKNINSFRAIWRAIAYEYELQSSALTAGRSWDQCTKRRDDLSGTASILRSKENALDYRYQPEPDLPPLILDHATISNDDGTTIDLAQVIETMHTQRWLHKEYINTLLLDRASYRYAADLITQGYEPKTVLKRMAGPLSAWANAHCATPGTTPITPPMLAQFMDMVKEKNLSDSLAKSFLEQRCAWWSWDDLLTTLPHPTMINYAHLCTTIITRFPDQVAQFKAGKESVIMFLVWQGMKLSQWWADATMLKEQLITTLCSS